MKSELVAANDVTFLQAIKIVFVNGSSTMMVPLLICGGHFFHGGQ
jgi:hypothetical protein